mgnify:CR=1 FL=1
MSHSLILLSIQHIMKKTEKVSSTPQIQAHLKSLLAALAENKAVTPEMIKEMKEMRERFIEIEQPTIVKSIRLVYEHLAAYETINNLSYWEAEEVELDDDNAGYEYYLGLLKNPANKYNREEIKEINVQLKAIADGIVDEEE